MAIQFKALPTDHVRALQCGGPDAYGQTPERRISDGDGMPCRHCLKNIAAGDGYLILAYRPFPELQPYAETGPVFFCADCTPAAPSPELPEILSSPSQILRGYDADGRIAYGTGGVVAREGIIARARDLLGRPGIIHVDVRSAANNCFLVRIRRA